MTATEAAPGNRTTHTFDVGTLRAGETIEVHTDHSIWYFTITDRKYRSGDYIVGVSIVTDSKGFGQSTRSPQEQGMSRTIRLGKSIKFRFGGNTGDVRSVKRGREVVLGGR